MRKIGVVTVARSDYGIYLPILKKIQSDCTLQLQLFVGGMHLSKRHGLTIQSIENDGFPIVDRINMQIESDDPESIANSIGLGVIGFSKSFVRNKPDIIVVLGDRFEMFSAALAALPLNIPVAHIHGGEITRGAIDDALRHSMTKLAHLHFVSTETYARRVKQLGEETWRVIVSGAPSLDNLDNLDFLPRKELEKSIGFDLDRPSLLVTFHPVTLEREQTESQIDAVLEALDRSQYACIFTMPNADTNNEKIVNRILSFVATHKNSKLVDNLGSTRYFSLMKYVTAMIGNSSSGLIEAPSFKLPVVNIGIRQEGRVRAANVIDVECEPQKILSAIKKASSTDFRNSLENLQNPYKQPGASDIIVDKLKSIKIDDQLLIKIFSDIV